MWKCSCHSQTKSWIKLKPTYVEAQGPQCFGKVPFATSGPPNSTNTGDMHKNNYKNIILQEAMENLVFPDEIKTKLMNLMKMNKFIFYMP